ncbi:hypothetical protein [Halobacillus ihumii]|uniref:hypothetical protein n=1 Tax=Halobacillus ihumii TaxID=2686092 RepID=UPI0013D71922|nr:hypothetical protein [Halobacillus ihumii]
MRKKQPEKLSWKEFLIEPITLAFIGIGEGLSKIIGFWECDDCGNIHSPRTRKYGVSMGATNSKTICSNCAHKRRISTETRKIHSELSQMFKR